jgi:uncharacterized protein YrrD
MLNSISHLDGSTVTATDGTIGHVREAYFDDVAWAIRYLVIDTGTWLSGREVLISPYAVKPPLGSARNIDVALTRQQVQDSPVTDTHQPVSRRHEREQLGYYAYPEYWAGGDLWAMNTLPMLPPPLPNGVESEAERVRRDADVLPEDVHLRSSANVTGYDIQATDDSIGHVTDFLFDDASWAIRYLVVDTRNWWPGGKKVLLATRWIDRIDWADKTVYTSLTREQVKNSPEYDEAATLGREDEKRLHDAYGREGYWD